ncbi:acyl-ACP--UDP-N-acetylglucosamine O-acyltransferase [Martelella mediterranea]|uniref:acyl-ACP--UDP-N-acetylglucosamine O-acyltransferase n=1 Tax=Martelella mediterranea TaxID=293089 RepID=UPI001E46799E|nr:acyl-ACP--UDP-N-acetylglucosamine O-acyltransferase [Martelella mediterranea]MCD1632160.1 acyl-ACP--UDP-N-acetylglucosamine O-acyltransferase [Martelella mediterranea]
MTRIASSARIDPKAVVEDGAVIGENAIIGPLSYVGPNAVLGDGVVVMHHASVEGMTRLGPGCQVFPMAVIGGAPQSVRHDASETRLEIGRNCIFREGVTINTGSSHGGGITIIGDNNLFLANSHIGHDCRIGNDVILSNNVMIGGHVVVHDKVILSGGAAIHQFVQIGRQAFVGGLAGVVNDVIPYAMIVDNPAMMGGLNVVGMQRAGIERDEIHLVRKAYKTIFSSGLILENAESARAEFGGKSDAVDEMLRFILERDAERSLTTPGSRRRKGTA